MISFAGRRYSTSFKYPVDYPVDSVPYCVLEPGGSVSKHIIAAFADSWIWRIKAREFS